MFNKKIFLLSFCLILLFSFSFSLRNQTHRLGFKAGLYYPAEQGKATGIETEIHFDAVIHDHVDAGPHFGLFLKNVESSVSITENSKFVVVPITFQFRFYPFYSKESGSTHGVISPYLAFSSGYYFALLYDTNSLNISKVPDGLGGIGFNGAFGIDFGIGPNTSYFAEISYRLTKLRSIRGYDLDLNGITLSAGGRF
jgi:hypothetical protein